MENFCGLLLRTYTETLHHFLPQRALSAHKKGENENKMEDVLLLHKFWLNVDSSAGVDLHRSSDAAAVWSNAAANIWQTKALTCNRTHLAVTSFLTV